MELINLESPVMLLRPPAAPSAHSRGARTIRTAPAPAYGLSPGL